MGGLLSFPGYLPSMQDAYILDLCFTPVSLSFIMRAGGGLSQGFEKGGYCTSSPIEPPYLIIGSVTALGLGIEQ